MSLPPERINIKRKRDSEAVDVLFIQDKKRPRTEFVFRKVAPVDGVNSAAGESLFQNLSIDPTSESPTRSSSAAHGLNSSEIEAKKTRLREFRLDKPVKSDVHKNGWPRFPDKKKLATLVETRRQKSRLAKRAKKALPPRVDLPATGPEKTHVSAHKRIRPQRSALQLRWQQVRSASEARSRSTSRAPAPVADPDDPAQLQLAQQLSAFALETSQTLSPSSLSNSVVLDEAKPKPALKFQPKPAVPRGRTREQGAHNDAEVADVEMDAASISDSESEYEYDTYIRVPVPAENMDIDMTVQMSGMGDKTLGVLVIEEEDEELWATYALEDEQEVGFDTDEEDENAEDYYGNDYPEEDLDSDDEFGGGAYGYRYAHSDDEQFGNHDEDDGEWSDVEDRPPRLIGSSGRNLGDFVSPVQHNGLDPY